MSWEVQTGTSTSFIYYGVIDANIVVIINKAIGNKHEIRILRRGGKVKGETERKGGKRRIERLQEMGEETIEISFLASYTGIIIIMVFTSPHKNSVWHINKSNTHFHRTKE